MKIILLILGALVASYVLYSGVRLFSLLQVSKKMVQETIPFQLLSNNTSVSMLVLGDSTAVGVGADSSEGSVPGRVAQYLTATYVENLAVSGAVVADLFDQVPGAKLSQYSLILIQIGANDMVRVRDAEEAAGMLGLVLKELPPADTVLVISAGDLGTARIFPLPIQSVYSGVNQRYHVAFAKTVAEEGAIYVDLSKGPGVELFETDPGTYFAADRFHLSSAGYGLWFDAIREKLDAR